MSEKWYQKYYKEREQRQFPDNDAGPEIEPVPGEPGVFRKVIRPENTEDEKKPDPATSINEINQETLENEKKAELIPDIDEIKKEIFEADAIEAGRLEDNINEVIFRGGEGDHPNYDLKAKPIEFPKENEEKKTETQRRRPPSDSHEFEFEYKKSSK
ncbi:MAG TPA: hypothetical protein P5548_04435 [Candidatus Moranbacteria bacterium]|nr:hypothetical protein [Candidatus Moranbacteria bacterium]HRZ34117.1 hypothetical protein [Candidatus Moranbacteria bacterium]